MFVPLFLALCPGRQDTTQTERDSHRDTLGVEQTKRPLFNKLHRDVDRDKGGTVLSEWCLIPFRPMGRCCGRWMGSR
jgi:hypothetical protein